ncbi:hypothetical protein [Streptomyces sp. GS7]|uniref:hypothetical protein n=1 Tax=Streptomyces sp. GS7 TaxID=2692234 RepID=UPI0013182224|nr:hypothetical protein [Streptomyces sp. GS7]QHC23154.1 hypothetical protein GR130_18780 [Streptomyces sp. GS7]
MPLPPHTPQSAAAAAERAGIPLHADRHAPVAATADHILAVVSRLRDLDLDDLPPAPSYRADSGR